jgi:hypothetical protein
MRTPPAHRARESPGPYPGCTVRGDGGDADSRVVWLRRHGRAAAPARGNRKLDARADKERAGVLRDVGGAQVQAKGSRPAAQQGRLRGLSSRRRRTNPRVFGLPGRANASAAVRDERPSAPRVAAATVDGHQLCARPRAALSLRGEAVGKTDPQTGASFNSARCRAAEPFEWDEPVSGRPSGRSVPPLRAQPISTYFPDGLSQKRQSRRAGAHYSLGRRLSGKGGPPWFRGGSPQSWGARPRTAPLGDAQRLRLAGPVGAAVWSFQHRPGFFRQARRGAVAV